MNKITFITPGGGSNAGKEPNHSAPHASIPGSYGTLIWAGLLTYSLF